MKSTQRIHSTREETYRQAFGQFTDGQAFAWKERWPDGPFLALYQDNVYQIESTDDLRERARLMLTSTDEAANMPLTIWIDLVEEIYNEIDCFTRLLGRLTTPEEQHLRVALAISRITSRPVEGFWSTLYYLDSRLYPRAIIALTRIHDVESLWLKLSEALVRNGKTVLNQQREGVFRTLRLDPGNPAADSRFYVFTVDPAIWEFDVLV